MPPRASEAASPPSVSLVATPSLKPRALSSASVRSAPSTGTACLAPPSL